MDIATTPRLPTSSSSTGWPIASNRHLASPRPPCRSYAHSQLQAGLLNAVLQRCKLVVKFAEFAVAEFRKDEIVEGFLLGSQACEELIGLIRQGHLHDPGVVP